MVHVNTVRQDWKAGVLSWMGPIKASIESILFAHMGWWRSQLGEDFSTCQAERQAGCPRVLQSRLRTAQGHGELSRIFGEDNY